MEREILTVNLPYIGTPYSPWIYPTTEHPNHLGSALMEHPTLNSSSPNFYMITPSPALSNYILF